MRISDWSSDVCSSDLIDAAARRKICLGLLRQPFGQDLAALIGQAPAGGAASVEDGDPHQLAHRGQADDAHFAALAAGKENVILVQLAGAAMELGRASCRERVCRYV